VGARAALKDSGVTIILTTHYIEEAEQMADRIGVISRGELILVEEKDRLMHKLGRKQLKCSSPRSSPRSRPSSPVYALELFCRRDGAVYTFDNEGERTRIHGAAEGPRRARDRIKDLNTAKLAGGYLREPGAG
jgi:ABC-2 type transport system ATP-binding protein